VDILWCQSAQNIGLFNHKLKSALTCTVWSQCMSVPDGQTDGRTSRWRDDSFQRTHRAKKFRRNCGSEKQLSQRNLLLMCLFWAKHTDLRKEQT